jgi:glycosyltransferase involved in cell wall biosynthesis
LEAETPVGPPRVLMIGRGWFPATVGGLDRYYRSLLESLPGSRGVVLGPSGDAPAEVSAVACPEVMLPRRLVAIWIAAQRQADACDLVDAHFALYAALPVLIGRLRGRPTVFHFQGPWAAESVSAGDSSRLKRMLRHGLERRTLRAADAFVVLSGAFRQILVEEYGVKPWDIHVEAPGVELEAFSPGDQGPARARLNLDESAFVVACVRRLVPRMGLDLLLDAWTELDGRLPDGSTLLVVGDGQLREELTARVSTPKLADRVRLLGRVEDSKLIDVYRAANVAAVPSTAFEGFGLVVLEAAACGTPTLVSDVGGLPEAVHELDSSLVLPADNVQAWTRRLSEAAAGALPSRPATRKFARKFGWPAVAERHLALYRRVAAGLHDERRRVVYVDHVARLSGGEIALLRLLPHLSDVNAHVILGEDGPLVQRLHTAGISVEVLPIAESARDARRGTMRTGGVSARVVIETGSYIARLTRRLRQLRPELVHTNSLKAGVYGSLAARAAGIPVVWHVHDRISRDYLPREAVTGLRLLLRRLPDAVVANSAATLATIRPPRRTGIAEVLPNVLSPPGRPPGVVRSRSRDGVTFGIVGRIAPWKGQDLFVRAFAQSFPDGPERAVIIGSPLFGEEDYARDVVALAVGLGVRERVDFRGFRDDIFAELASLDVLVHASVIPEPFGQVVLEGMVAGLPVIASDQGGPAEMITSGKNGLLFASGNVTALARTMRELVDRPGERSRLGAEAAANAAAAHEPGVVAAQLRSIYDRVLAAGRTDR